MSKKDNDTFDMSRAELFEALGHPLRLKMLETLGLHPLSFSDLKRQFGIDSSGLLTFHLSKLQGLVKISLEGNYELTDEGKEALRIMNLIDSKITAPKKTDKKIKPVLKVAAVLALIIVACVSTYVFINYQSQLGNENDIIQQNFVQRTFNYTIVTSYEVSTYYSDNPFSLSWGNLGNWALVNVSLIPLNNEESINVHDLQVNNTPLMNLVYPSTLMYTFQNNSVSIADLYFQGILNASSLNGTDVVSLGNPPYHNYVNTTFTYYTYTRANNDDIPEKFIVYHF